MSELRVTCTAAPEVFLISEGRTTVATVYRGGRELAEAMAVAGTAALDEKGAANAAFIVRACNSHDELLEALAAIRSCYPKTSNAYRIADQALAKAGGQS